MSDAGYPIVLIAVIFIAAGGPMGITLLVSLLRDRRFRKQR